MAVLNEGLSLVIADGSFERLYLKWIFPVIGPKVSYAFLYSLYGIIGVLLIAMIVFILVSRFLKIMIKKKSEELYVMKAQLLYENKMSAMGEMIAAITHQWKQPLNVLGLYSEMLEDISGVSEDIQREIDKVKDGVAGQVSFMAQTADEFQCFFKDDPEETKIECCKLLEETIFIGMLRSVNPNIKVEIHTHEHFMISCYVGQFKHVLLNIFSNARDIFSEKKTLNPQIDIYVEQKDQMGIIRVRDNGGGVPVELLPDKLFRSRISTKKGKGMGIGLYLARMIMEEKMKGQISATNINGGTEFVLKFPL